MRKTSRIVLPLAVFGGLFLLASPLLFEYPPFGLLIWALICAIYAFGMKKARGETLRLEREERSLRLAEEGDPWRDPEDGSEASRRIAAARRLGEEGAATADFSEILSARESSRGLGGLSGAVVVLGLLGTFYGLMLVVSAAGPAVEQQGGTIDIKLVLQPVLSGMRGIFGTSICGLVAAFFLNIAGTALQTAQMRFMADVEEFTRLRLLPSFAKRGSADRNALPEERLAAFAGEIAAKFDAVSASFAAATESMRAERDSALAGIREAQEKALRDAAEGRAAAAELQKASLESLGRELSAGIAELGNAARGGSGSEALGAKMDEIAGALSEIRKSLAVPETPAAPDPRLDAIVSALSDLRNLLAENAARTAAPAPAAASAPAAGNPDALAAAAEGLAQSLALVKSNQIEFQSGLEMFSKGMEELLEGLRRRQEEDGTLDNYFNRLEAALEAFQERAAETLQESSVQTQEILLEVLRQAKAGQNGGKPEAGG